VMKFLSRLVEIKILSITQVVNFTAHVGKTTQQQHC
jgi:hypothetical protein